MYKSLKKRKFKDTEAQEKSIGDEDPLGEHMKNVRILN